MKLIKNTYLLPVLLAVFFLFSSASLSAQGPENGPASKEKHSAHKATLYSAVLPGLGQAYNKKYWKVPLVYAGFGALGYMVYSNNLEYQLIVKAYDYRMAYGENSDEPIPNEYAESDLSNADIIKFKDYYRKERERSIIYTTLWYFLNIIDASVDAHLFEFDVSDNLSLKMEPSFNYVPIGIQKPIAGLKLSISIP